jgi:membrane protein implicated in regulation of membrane protease activity
MCHIFLLLPLFGLPLFLILPWEEALPLYAGVCVLSAGFYWLLWRTMRRPATTGIEGMMGGVGTVFRSSEGKMKVFYRGEIWEAVSKEAIAPGERAEIVGYERMRLVVRRRT